MCVNHSEMVSHSYMNSLLSYWQNWPNVFLFFQSFWLKEYCSGPGPILSVFLTERILQWTGDGGRQMYDGGDVGDGDDGVPQNVKRTNVLLNTLILVPLDGQVPIVLLMTKRSRQERQQTGNGKRQ